MDRMPGFTRTENIDAKTLHIQLPQWIWKTVLEYFTKGWQMRRGDSNILSKTLGSMCANKPLIRYQSHVCFQLKEYKPHQYLSGLMVTFLDSCEHLHFLTYFWHRLCYLENHHFIFGSLVHVPLFSWRQHKCSFTLGDSLHKLLEFNQNCWSEF
jgi:hypothetical protein